MENILPDEIRLHMTPMIVKIQIECAILTLDVLLQTATTTNVIAVILDIVRDQLLFIEILHIVNLRLHTKETKHQS